MSLVTLLEVKDFSFVIQHRDNMSKWVVLPKTAEILSTPCMDLAVLP